MWKGRSRFWKLFGVSLVLAAIVVGTVTLTFESKELTPQELVDVANVKNKTRLSRVEKIEDTELKEALEGIVSTAYFMELIAADGHVKPKEPEYTNSEFRRVKDYDSLEEMAKVFVENYFAKRTSFRGPCVTPQAPFPYPFETSLTWRKIALENGDTINLPPEISGEAGGYELSTFASGICYRVPQTDDAPLPRILTGRLSAYIPKQLIQFDFNRDDIGKSIRKGDYIVTLLDADEFSYMVGVKWDGDGDSPIGDDGVVGEALDEAGKYLTRNRSRTGHPEFFENFDGLVDKLIDMGVDGTLTVDNLEKRAEAIMADVPRGLYKSYWFSGSYTTARITIPDFGADREAIVRDLKLPVHYLGSFDRGIEKNPRIDIIPTHEPVYDYEMSSLEATKLELEPYQVGTTISIKQNDMALLAKNSAQVSLEYPKVESRLFIDDSFDRFDDPKFIKFYNAEGKEIRLPPDDPEYYQFMVDRIEYNPERFPEKPVRVSSKIPVVIAPAITKERYTRDKLPSGIVMKDNMVIVNRDVFEPKDRNFRFFGKSADDRFLLKHSDVRHEMAFGSYLDVYYYYGTPETLEIWYQGETRRVNYTLDIELDEPPEKE